jgi:hypothetical protein
MKKINVLLFALFSSLAIATQAQTFNKGDKVLNVGIGLGSVYGYAGYGSSLPPLSASFEVGITDKVGIGRVGVGGIFAYSKYGDSNFSVSNIIIGARGLYHFDFDVEKLDVYGGVMLGYNIVSTSPDYSTISGGFGFVNPYGSYVTGGVFAGARYMFSEKIGGFGELGYSIAWLNLGLTVKF